MDIMRSTLNWKMEQTMIVRRVGNVCTSCRTYVEPPNDVDTEMAISKLKNGKATGYDQIPVKMIKKGGRDHTI
jgi:hypothetical protein